MELLLIFILLFSFVGFAIFGKSIFVKTDKIDANETAPYVPRKEIRRTYKKDYVEIQPILGMQFRDLSDVKKGLFFGEATCDYNEHDEYSIAIYDQDYTHLGYVPKKQKKLHRIIEEEHGGTIFCWGSKRFDPYSNEWSGRVYIPRGLSPQEVQDVKQGFLLQSKRDNILKKVNDNADLFISALEIQKQIDQIINAYPEVDIYDTFRLQKTYFPSVVKELFERKEWQKIVDLEQYIEYVDEIGETYKPALLRRIEKAKEMIQAQ